MKVVTIEIPDDSELIKEGNIYKICQVIPKTWEEFCNRTPIRREYFIGYDSKINLERIKELFLALKKKRLLNKMNRINPNPAEYKKMGTSYLG